MRSAELRSDSEAAELSVELEAWNGMECPRSIHGYLSTFNRKIVA